jgi:uncharacterized protein YgbK (DUF1537 family)
MATVYGPLVTPWYFLATAIAGLVTIYRSYLGDQANRLGNEHLLPGEAGTFRALAGARRPMTAEQLSKYIPHTADEVRYRLERLEEDDLVRTNEEHGEKQYFVVSTEHHSSTLKTSAQDDAEIMKERETE